MAKQLNIPVYVVCDADTDTVKKDHIVKHKQDNASILSLVGRTEILDWPEYNIWISDLTMWKTNLTQLVQREKGENWKKHVDAAAAYYGHPGGLEKNPLAVSRALKSAWDAGEKSRSLIRLSESIINFAEKSINEN